MIVCDCVYVCVCARPTLAALDIVKRCNERNSLTSLLFIAPRIDETEIYICTYSIQKYNNITSFPRRKKALSEPVIPDGQRYQIRAIV